MFSAPKFIAVEIPITSPWTLTSGPPELPRLIAASVWMKLSKDVSPVRPGSTRPLALTIPTVTDDASERGLPAAITHSPTRSSSLEPSARYGKGSSRSILRTARSVAASVPFTSASYSRSSSRTVTLVAPSMTWLLVTIQPSELTRKPLPAPS